MSDATASHHHHDDDSSGTDGFVHRARWYVAPLAAIAAVLSALYGYGLAFAVGAVVSWLFLLLFVFTNSAHDWRVCPLCDAPPRSTATAEARALLARHQHGRWRRSVMRMALTGLLAHAILPKPYHDPPWWARAIAAAVYFTVAMLFALSARRLIQHSWYTDECHVDWCRAGLKRKPGTTWRQRLAVWVGHYAMWCIIVMAPATCAVGVYSVHQPSLGWRLGYAVMLLLLVVVVLNTALDHTWELCVHCAKNPPSNGGLSAERRMRWLRLFHVTGVPALIGAFVVWAGSWVFAGSMAAKILVCCAALVVMFWAVLERIHSPVKPWCPWCRDDDDGEDSHASTPDPASNVPTPV